MIVSRPHGTVRHIAKLVLLIFVVSFSNGAIFSWSGHGSDDDWDTCSNWVQFGSSGNCYPDDNDEAIVPSMGTPPTINIAPSQIEVAELTVNGSVTFTGGALNTPLVFVQGASGGTTITVSGGAFLSTAPSSP